VRLDVSEEGVAPLEEQPKDDTINKESKNRNLKYRNRLFMIEADTII